MNDEAGRRAEGVRSISRLEGVVWRWTLLATLVTVGWWVRPDRVRYEVHDCRRFDNEIRLSEDERRERLEALLARPRTYGFRIDSMLLATPPSPRWYQALRECLLTDRRTGELSVTYWIITDDGEVERWTRP